MNPLINQISADLRPIEYALLSQVNPLDPDELQALMATYPELASLDVRTPLLSNIAAQLASEGGTLIPAPTNPDGQNSLVPALGALQPNEDVRHSVGLTLGPPPIDTTSPINGPSFSAVDLRVPNWPVHDQNPRGTCIAFAATACLEIRQSPRIDLSEQFLYWTIKDHHDGQPYTEGTWLNFAGDALLQDGICIESLCPYINTIESSTMFVGGRRPSPAAFSDALSRTPTTIHDNGGTAAAIHASIASGKPVAVSLPVFASASNPNQHNWNSPVGLNRGVVLNPPPTATVVGGHAVCVTGFVPHLAEPNGGYFIIRNSWGTGWGASGTVGNPRNPEPGYGSVSATYVDLYAWEWLRV